MLRKIFLSTACAVPFLAAIAQDSSKSVVFTGGMDAYYRHNFSGTTNNFTSFTNSQQSFELGMATLKADATALKGKVGATFDLGFGRRAEEFSYNDGENNTGLPGGVSKSGFVTLAAIKQAYITASPTQNLKFTAGKFATHVGYELVDAYANKNYSMSYMFTNGPFFHTGVKFDFTKNDWGFMLGVSDYTDQTTSSTEVKNLIGQVSKSFAEGKHKLYLNYSGFGGSTSGQNPSGLKSMHQYDMVFTSTLNAKWSAGVNATLQQRNQINSSASKSGSWKAAAIYTNYVYNKTFGLATRIEFVADRDQVYFNTKNIFAATVTPCFKFGALAIMPELRFEQSAAAIYTKPNAIGSKNTLSGIIAVSFNF